MILTLRRRHRTMIVAGALVATGVLFVGLSARAPTPVDNSLQSYRNILPSDAVLIGEHAVRVGAAALNVALFKTQASAAPWHLSVSAIANRQSAGPDVLLYWQDSASGDKLDVEATLLGPLLAQRESVLPLLISEPDGQLVFYSLAHQSVLSTVNLTTLE